MSMKNSNGTKWLSNTAQHLNHCGTAVPRNSIGNIHISLPIWVKFGTDNLYVVQFSSYEFRENGYSYNLTQLTSRFASLNLRES